MLFIDLCKKYDVKYDESLFWDIDIPDEWENDDVSYEFDGNNHTWKKNNGKDYIIFNGSDYYLHHLKHPNSHRCFEECISGYVRYIT